MKKITIGFSTHKKWNIFSALIKMVDRTPYSHTYVVFQSVRLDRGLVYHAAKSFLHFLSLGNFMQVNKVFYEFDIMVSEEQEVKILQICIDRAGLKYGMAAVVGVAMVKFAKLFNFDIENPFQDGGKTYFCSELVSLVLEELGLKTNPVNAEDASVSWLCKMLQDLATEDKVVMREFK